MLQFVLMSYNVKWLNKNYYFIFTDDVVASDDITMFYSRNYSTDHGAVTLPLLSRKTSAGSLFLTKFPIKSRLKKQH